MPRTPSANSTSRLVPRSRIFQRDHGNDVHAPSTAHRFLLRLSRNLDTLGFARVNKNEGWEEGKERRDQKFAGIRANDSTRRVHRRFNDFHFHTVLTYLWLAGRHSIRRKNERNPALDIDFLSESLILLVFRKGAEESSLASWKRFSIVGRNEQRNSITELSVSPAFLSNSLRLNIIVSCIYTYTYIYI